MYFCSHQSYGNQIRQGVFGRVVPERKKKYRFQPQVVKKYQKRIDTLAGVTRIEELFTLNSLNFEALESSGNYSIRIDYHYRLEFQVSNSDTEPIITICLIMDITNHYE